MRYNKRNNFLKHFVIIGGGTVINLLIGLITTPIITRLVEPSEYGQLSIFIMYTNIAVMVVCMGLDQALVRYFYEQDDVNYRRALLFKCIKYPLMIWCGLAVLFITLTRTEVIHFEFSAYINLLLCVNIFVQVIYRFSQLLVRLAYKSKLYSTLNILQKLFYVSFSLIFLYIVADCDFLVLASATVLSYFICMYVSIVAQKDIWSKKMVSSYYINTKELFKYAYPYIFSMGITTFFQAIDKLSLNYYCSYNEVGVYSSTMTLVHIFGIIQTTFNALWAPMAMEHYASDKENRRFYQQGNSIITVVMFFIGISLILGKDIFAVFLGEKYREAAYILPFLIFNPIMYTISETTVSGLVFKKKSSLQIVVAFGACVTNIVGNTVLVPQLGSRGAAISTGISYIVFFTLRTILSNRYFYVDFSLKSFYVLTGVVVVYAFYNTFIKFNIGSVVGYIICLGALILLYRRTIVWGMRYIRDMANDFYINVIKNK